MEIKKKQSVKSRTIARERTGWDDTRGRRKTLESRSITRGEKKSPDDRYTYRSHYTQKHNNRARAHTTHSKKRIYIYVISKQSIDLIAFLILSIDFSLSIVQAPSERVSGHFIFAFLVFFTYIMQLRNKLVELGHQFYESTILRGMIRYH